LDAYFKYDGYEDEDSLVLSVYNVFSIFQQLIKWHFWPSMPEGEKVVYVSDEFNPYK